LEQACLEANDEAFAYTPVEFHTENMVQYNVAGIHMGVIAVFGRTAEFPLHLGQVRFPQETVSVLNSGNAFKAQSLNQPVLNNAVVPFHPAFCLGAVRRDDFDPRLVARPAKMAFRLKNTRSNLGTGRFPGQDKGVFPVSIQRFGYSVSFYPPF
jgi:hypothetical protein